MFNHCFSSCQPTSSNDLLAKSQSSFYTIIRSKLLKNFILLTHINNCEQSFLLIKSFNLMVEIDKKVRDASNFWIYYLQEGSVYIIVMKYLTSCLKSTRVIAIDGDEQNSSQISSNESGSQHTPFIKQYKHHQIAKFSRIQPIRRGFTTNHPSKSHYSQKLQQISISEEQVQIIYEPLLRKTSDQIEAKCFKKKLMKGKLHSSLQCSICLGSLQFKEPQQIGSLSCNHSFCYDCIFHSSRFCNRCPYCRTSFKHINRNNELVPVQHKELYYDFDPYEQPCYICGRNDDFDHLLECEYCESAFCHTYCDYRLESDVPPEQSWYCLSCSNLISANH